MKVENIKFKAKRLDNGKWVIGDLSYSCENGASIVSTEEGVFQLTLKRSASPRVSTIKMAKKSLKMILFKILKVRRYLLSYLMLYVTVILLLPRRSVHADGL